MEKANLYFGGTVSKNGNYVRWDQDPFNNKWYSKGESLTEGDIKKAKRLEATDVLYKTPVPKGIDLNEEGEGYKITHLGVACRREPAGKMFYPLEFDYTLLLGLGGEKVQNHEAAAASEIVLSTYHTWESMRLGSTYRSKMHPDYKVVFSEDEEGNRWATVLPFRWKIKVLPSEEQNEWGQKIKTAWVERTYDYAGKRESILKAGRLITRDLTNTVSVENESRSGALGADWNA